MRLAHPLLSREFVLRALAFCAAATVVVITAIPLYFHFGALVTMVLFGAPLAAGGAVFGVLWVISRFKALEERVQLLEASCVR